MGQIQHFLLVFDLQNHALIHFQPFGEDAVAATRAYSDIEQEYREHGDSRQFEIVLIGADSEETIRITHSRYFNGGVGVPFSFA